MRPSRYVATFDSAGAMLLALAAYLHGRDFPALGAPRVLAPPVAVSNLLPPRLRERVYAASGGRTALPPDRLARPFAEDVAAWVTSRYPRRQYPAVLVGASNGAALHLAAALGVPWLPQTYLIPVQSRDNDPDDPRQALAQARGPAAGLLDANPDLQLHHMHDPVQDRLMLGSMRYFRVKRRRLGAAYERFLADNLAPGGTLILLDCQQRWPATQVGERHLFQFGAVGGATQAELLHGGDRVADYLARYRPGQDGWDPPAPDTHAPEAEWGLEPSLAGDLERFAGERGYRLRRLTFGHPTDLSPLVADLYRAWYQQRGLPDSRLLVESFILVEPWWTLAAGLVPLWTTFNTEDAAAAVERYLDRRSFQEISLTLFSHGVESVGLAPIRRWRAILARAERTGRLLGVDERAFPRDFATFVRYQSSLRRLGRRAPMPDPLPLAALEELLERSGDQFAVRWGELPTGGPS